MIVYILKRYIQASSHTYSLPGIGNPLLRFLDSPAVAKRIIRRRMLEVMDNKVNLNSRTCIEGAVFKC
jgi:hypothetical protein